MGRLLSLKSEKIDEDNNTEPTKNEEEEEEDKAPRCSQFSGFSPSEYLFMCIKK